MKPSPRLSSATASRWSSGILAAVLFGLLAPLGGAGCQNQSPALDRPGEATPILLPREPGGDSVDATLDGMSLPEKAGQLFMGWSLSRAESGPERAALLRQLRAGCLGGVVLSTGTMAEAQALMAELQAAAPRPLLFAGDFETGLSMRLRDAPHLGNAMLLGATGSTLLARRVGQATGVTGRSLGFQIAFAPVMDVNNNPDNPIINVRSFGEHPQTVARLGAALITGLQENMVATAKHFPGHGDVDADSHLVLPAVHASRARLDGLELVPFRAAIDAGVGAVMTAHLQVPALDPRPKTPATVSAPVLTGLLRKELGFAGLIVTDALEMGGVQKVMPAADAAVAALAAGADLLLMPPDPVAARDAVVAAVRSGAVPLGRLDDAVRKILSLKKPRAEPAPKIDPAADRQLGAEIAQRGLTLVRDVRGLVPLARERKVLLLQLQDDETGTRGEALAAELRVAGLLAENRVLHPGTSKGDVTAALEAARAAPALVVAMHVAVREFSGRIGLPENLRGIGAVLETHTGAVTIAFGNPYLARGFPKVGTYLCAYDQGPVIERAVARALRGAAPITGRLPVAIPGVADLGAGFSRYRGLGTAAPEAEGFVPDLEQRIQDLLAERVARKVFPGAVALVARRGRVVARVAVGRETYEEGAAKITTDSLFDLASLTKVCATLPAVAVLLDRGVMKLDDRLSRWVPAFQGPGKDQVTLRHVMVHSSGLPAYIRFYRNGLEGKADIVAKSASTELRFEPGSKRVYSDLGLILLMAAVENASGKTLDRFLAEEVYPSLGVAARFGSADTRLQAVPTEIDPWRQRLVRGEVHDENAFAMGGVSGHAGLFGRAEDVARIGVLFLGGGSGLIAPDRVARLIRRDGLVPGSTRALLWDTFKRGGSGGSKLSPTAFGHTGFTGTSIWCDPPRDLCMVLLTNRVHPTRKNSKITAARRAFHDLVIDCLEPAR